MKGGVVCLSALSKNHNPCLQNLPISISTADQRCRAFLVPGALQDRPLLKRQDSSGTSDSGPLVLQSFQIKPVVLFPKFSAKAPWSLYQYSIHLASVLFSSAAETPIISGRLIFPLLLSFPIFLSFSSKASPFDYKLIPLRDTQWLFVVSTKCFMLFHVVVMWEWWCARTYLDIYALFEINS